MNKDRKTTKKKTAVSAPAEAGRKGTHTLDSLVALLGPVDEPLRTALFENVLDEALVKRGTRVLSTSILDDAPLFLGSTYNIWQAITDVQRAKVNIDPQVFALCLDEAHILRRLVQGFHAVVTTSASDQVEHSVEVRQVVSEGVALRSSVVDSLKSVLDPAQVAHVKKLAGTAETPETLAGGMKRIADYVSALLKNNTESQRRRLSTFNITAERATALKSKAEQVRLTGAVTVAAVRRVEQRKLDLQDGRVLLLMEHILRAFRAAHREDPTILLPEVRALASVFNTRPTTTRRKPRTPPKAKARVASDAGAASGEGTADDPGPVAEAKETKAKAKARKRKKR